MAGQQQNDHMTDEQLRLARDQGDTYRDALAHLIKDVAHIGRMQEVRDVVIGFAQEQAQGLYVLNAESDLRWRAPGDHNCHLTVAVMDAEDNRFLPYLDIDVTVFNQQDTAHGPFDMPFVWHPGLHRYGRNITLPGDGQYDIRVHVDAPTFERRGRKRGNRYTTPVEAVFENVEIATGTG